MKKTIDGKRYDTNRCEILGRHDHHSHSGNYSGTTSLVMAPNGKLLIWTDSNGQDCYLRDDLYAFDSAENWTIDDFDMDEMQEKRCAELGLIEIV